MGQLMYKWIVTDRAEVGLPACVCHMVVLKCISPFEWLFAMWTRVNKTALDLNSFRVWLKYLCMYNWLLFSNPFSHNWQQTAVGNQGMLPNPVLLQCSHGSTHSTTDVAGKYSCLISRVYCLVVPFQIIPLGEHLATGHTAPACLSSEVAVLSWCTSLKCLFAYSLLGNVIGHRWQIDGFLWWSPCNIQHIDMKQHPPPQYWSGEPLEAPPEMT